MQIKKIIFDLDGTLIDSAPSILSTIVETITYHDLKPVIKLDSSIIGPPLDVIFKRLTGCNDSALTQSLIDTFKLKYDSFSYKETTAFPGVNKLLKELNQLKIPIYIATNKRLKPTFLILDHLGWTNFFKSVYTLDSAFPSHLNKEKMLAQSRRDIGGLPQNIAYVGDKDDDGLAAKANSMPFFKACWGYCDEEIDMISYSWNKLEYPADLMLLI